jgi:hypothetical protein
MIWFFLLGVALVWLIVEICEKRKNANSTLWVSDSAEDCDNARVYGNAKIYVNPKVVKRDDSYYLEEN